MYGAFARVYDKFMESTPYDEWIELAERIWAEHGTLGNLPGEGDKGRKLILDLGCGTGNITRRLAKKGYDMIGIDNSPDMLAEAMAKSCDDSQADEQKREILYLCQDMRSFELYGTVDGIVCICDGINYLTKSSDVSKVFRLAENYLNPGGVFIFDIITAYKYKMILADNSFSESNEDSAFIWDNWFDSETGINRYSVSFFISNETGLYERFDETHLQKAHSKKRILDLLEKAGLKTLGVYDEDGGAAKPKSERLFFAAGKMPL